MRGHVEKINGNYYVVIEMERDQETGKRKRRKYSVRKELGLPRKANKKDAENLLVNKLKELQEGQLIEPSEISLSEYLDSWIESHCKMHLDENTLDNYKTNINKNIKLQIGHLKLKDVKPLKLQNLYAKLSERLGSWTIRRIHNILYGAFEKAIEWEMMKSNPARSATPPRIEDKEVEVWSEKEVEAFLDEVKDHRYYPVYYLTLNTGLSRGEVLGLRWSDLDLNERAIYVRQALVVQNGKAVIKGLKTRSRKRKIAISQRVAETLKFHRKRQAAELEVINNENNLVFINQLGKRIYPTNLIRHFKNTIHKLGLKDIPFHGLRHTHATDLLKKGVHPEIVRERLGHSSIKVTIDTYSHVTMDMQKDIIDKLESQEDQKDKLEK